MSYIVVTGLTRLTPQIVIDKLTLVTDRMTGNLNFTTPTPPLLALTGIRDELSVLKNEIADLKEQIQEKEAQVEAKLLVARDLIQAEANYVQALVRASNNPSLASSAGFDLQAPGTATPSVLIPPQNVRMNEYRRSSGKLQLLFDPVDRATSYQIIYTYNIADPDSWLQTPILVSSTKNVVLTLTPGRQVWVKIKANGAGNAESDYSDVATRIVP